MKRTKAVLESENGDLKMELYCAKETIIKYRERVARYDARFLQLLDEIEAHRIVLRREQISEKKLLLAVHDDRKHHGVLQDEIQEFEGE